MKRVVVVGAGASAVHFALSALEKGWEVVLLDVGREGSAAVNPGDTLEGLKANLGDPARYFLGERFEAVLYPGSADEYYGFPPHKSYVFQPLSQYRVRSQGFSPLSSFAQGGLGEAWTGGAYPFNERELALFPVTYREFEPYYTLIARRIGITGTADDLAPYLPVHGDLLEPLRLDDHSRLLLESYQTAREAVNRKFQCFLGRSRTATLTRNVDGRKACGYLGRCLWGCPIEAFYTPALTLRQCRTYDRFCYLQGRYVTHFNIGTGRRITSVVAQGAHGGSAEEIPVDRLVLAAGTLSTSRIVMESVMRGGGGRVALRGLMDNRQIMMPFVNLRMLRRRYDPDTYQYHQLALAIPGSHPRDYVHGLITTLKTGLIHPIVQNVPLDLRSSLFLFKNVHAALGLVNINLADTPRDDNYLTLDEETSGSPARMLVNYAPDLDEPARLRRAIRTVRKVLGRLGCFVPPGMTHLRPMGASVHYAGTLPMRASGGAFTTTPECLSRDFENLIVADGSTFPFLPAKNLTLTLMANAARVADLVLD